jgi:hypothetical protein
MTSGVPFGVASCASRAFSDAKLPLSARCWSMNVLKFARGHAILDLKTPAPEGSAQARSGLLDVQ